MQKTGIHLISKINPDQGTSTANDAHKSNKRKRISSPINQSDKFLGGHLMSPLNSMNSVELVTTDEASK